MIVWADTRSLRPHPFGRAVGADPAPCRTGTGFLSVGWSRLFSPVASRSSARQAGDRGSIDAHRAFLAALGRATRQPSGPFYAGPPSGQQVA